MREASAAIEGPPGRNGQTGQDRAPHGQCSRGRGTLAAILRLWRGSCETPVKGEDLFHGDLSDQDKLVYVNDVLKAKLLESEVLRQQAVNNTKEQFSSSPDLASELVNAIMSALDAHTAMSTQALDSAEVQRGLKDILLNHADLYERLRAAGQSAAGV
jgi:hypothetical protein